MLYTCTYQFMGNEVIRTYNQEEIEMGVALPDEGEELLEIDVSCCNAEIDINGRCEICKEGCK